MKSRIKSYPCFKNLDFDIEAPKLEYIEIPYDKVHYFVFYCPRCKSYHTLNMTAGFYGVGYSYDYVTAKDIREKGTTYIGTSYKNDNGVPYCYITLARVEGSFGDVFGESNRMLYIVSKVANQTYGKYTKVYLKCPNTGEFIYYNDDSEAIPPNEEDPDNPEIDIPNEPGIDNPNQNASPPIIQEIQDFEVYQGIKFLIQFYAYDIDGYIKDFYFSMTGGEYWGRFVPSYIGSSVYANLFLFGDLGEYDCKIKAVDNNGLETESNNFKITVIPPPASFNPPNPPIVSNSEHIILYDKNSNEFESNGIGILKDCISCTVENELNGVYEVELCYPINTKFDDYLLDTEYIIKCNVDNNSNSQLFRIYDSEYIMQDNRIIVRGRHITYDLKDDFVEGISVLPTSCKNATQAIISNSRGNLKNKFLVSSNINTKRKFSISRVNTLEALIGVEGSIFDVYGNNNTVITRDNFKLGIEDKEVDRGVNISYSKNMVGFNRRINTENVITKIYPYTITRYGKIIRLTEKFIVSPNASKYSIEKIKAVEFNDGDILTENDLRNASANYFEENNIDMPSINYDVDFVLLYRSNENMASLERVSLGDLVTVNDSKINLSVKAKVIKTIYNSISNKYEKIELGNFKNEHRTSKKNERSNFKEIIRSVVN